MDQKISIIVPNFNGASLLARNIPKIQQYCPQAEIIVVDDASTDNSLSVVRKQFPKVKVLVNKKNMGFAASANLGAKNANGDLIVLLNSDVTPKKDFLKNALIHFEKVKNIFAVGLGDLSHEGKKTVLRGRGGANFRQGFLEHFALESKLGSTLWVSGGSGIFDKLKFLELGGFDVNFSPFYWEDIDLCFRAWSLGYICLFDPKSKVDHFHQQGAILQTKSRNFIKIVSYKNQFIFVWKNISDPLFLLSHIIYLPFHFLKSTLTLDWPFLVGFLWAVVKLPQIVINYDQSTKKPSLTDREILKKFERP